MEEHEVEAVTYEIVDVVDATYARLDNRDEEQNTADVEYLELDMEVVEAVSDAAEYYSNADDSQEEEGHAEEAIVNQHQRPQQVQQLIRINGNQCFAIKEENNFNNESDGGRKRKISEASYSDSSSYVNKDSEIDKSKEQMRKSEGDSLDLFFQSMAQTVLHLPPQVQAKIKMDICKVITMAEIKYCSTTTNNKTKTC